VKIATKEKEVGNHFTPRFVGKDGKDGGKKERFTPEENSIKKE